MLRIAARPAVSGQLLLNVCILLWLHCLLPRHLHVTLFPAAFAVQAPPQPQPQPPGIVAEEWLKLDLTCISAANDDTHHVYGSPSQQAARVLSDFSCFLNKNPFLLQHNVGLAGGVFVRMLFGPQSSAKSATLAELLGQLLSSSGSNTCTRVCSLVLNRPECHSLAVNREAIIEMTHPLLQDPQIQLPADAKRVSGGIAVNLFDALVMDDRIMTLLDHRGTFDSNCILKTAYMCDDDVMPAYTIDTAGLIAQGQQHSQELLEYSKKLLREYVVQKGGHKSNYVMLTHRLSMDAAHNPIPAVLADFYDAVTNSYPFKLALVLTFSNVDLDPIRVANKLQGVHSFPQLLQHFCHPILKSINAPQNTPCVFTSGSAVDTRQFLDLTAQSGVGLGGAKLEERASAKRNEKDLMAALNSLEHQPGFSSNKIEAAAFYSGHVGIKPLIALAESEQVRIFKAKAKDISFALEDVLRRYDTISSQATAELAATQNVNGALLADFFETLAMIFSWLVKGGKPLQHPRPWLGGAGPGQQPLNFEPNFMAFLQNHAGGNIVADHDLIQKSRSFCKDTQDIQCDIPAHFPSYIAMGQATQSVRDDHDRKTYEDALALIPPRLLSKPRLGGIARLEGQEVAAMAAHAFTEVEPLTAKSIQSIFDPALPSVFHWVHLILTTGMHSFNQQQRQYVGNMVAAIYYQNALLAMEYLRQYHPRFGYLLRTYSSEITEILKKRFYTGVYNDTRRRFEIYADQMSAGADHMLLFLQTLPMSTLKYVPDLHGAFLDTFRGTNEHKYRELYEQTKDKRAFSQSAGATASIWDNVPYIETTAKVVKNLQNELRAHRSQIKIEGETEEDLEKAVPLALAGLRWYAMQVSGARMTPQEVFELYLEMTSVGISIDRMVPVANVNNLRQQEVDWINLHIHRWVQARQNHFISSLHVELSSGLGEHLLNRNDDDCWEMIVEMFQTFIIAKLKGNGNSGTPALAIADAGVDVAKAVEEKLAEVRGNGPKLIAALRNGEFDTAVEQWDRLVSNDALAQKQSMLKSRIDAVRPIQSAIRNFQARIAEAIKANP